MKNQDTFEKAVKFVRADKSIEEKRQRVLSKYGPIFQPSNIHELDLDKFKHFFNFSENEHWTGLTQNMPQLLADPAKLKNALAELVDESKPLEERIDKVTGQNEDPMVKGLGAARISAILQVTYPDRYGVLNRVSTKGLTMIGLNPADSDSNWSSMTLGKQFILVNEVLVKLSKEYGVTLWAMDWVWWAILNPDDMTFEFEEEESPTYHTDPESKTEGNKTDNLRFSMEKHLEDFLVGNWESTILSKDFGLEVLTDDKTGETIGQQYYAGPRHRIDLLCRNKKNGGYTVIELKRHKTSYEVVGQVQTYMGWVAQNLAKGTPVDGIVISHEIDEDLRDALYVVPNVKCFVYQVSFQLSQGGLVS